MAIWNCQVAAGARSRRRGRWTSSTGGIWWPFGSCQVAAGARSQRRGARGYYASALQEAASGGHLEVVRLLLEHRADVEADTEGRIRSSTQHLVAIWKLSGCCWSTELQGRGHTCVNRQHLVAIWKSSGCCWSTEPT
jgi:hypothetical protein